MTAEKDSENGSIGGGNIAAGGNIKDTNKVNAQFQAYFL